MGLVKALAKALAWDPKIRDDLEGEGYVALIEAVDSYDPDRKDSPARLCTYAHQHIRGRMIDYCNKREIKISRGGRKLCKLVRECHDEIRHELQRKPTVEEIAESLGLTTQKVDIALELLALGFESVDAPAAADDDNIPRQLRSGGPTLEEQAMSSELAEAVRRALMTIKNINHRRAFICKFMDGMEYEEIAKELGHPENTIRSWVHRVKKHLFEDPQLQRIAEHFGFGGKDDGCA